MATRSVPSIADLEAGGCWAERPFWVDSRPSPKPIVNGAVAPNGVVGCVVRNWIEYLSRPKVCTPDDRVSVGLSFQISPPCGRSMVTYLPLRSRVRNHFMNCFESADAPRVSLRHIRAEQFPNRVTVHHYDCTIEDGIADQVRDHWAMVNAVLERLSNRHV
jgi:hypothetical protein